MNLPESTTNKRCPLHKKILLSIFSLISVGVIGCRSVNALEVKNIDYGYVKDKALSLSQSPFSPPQTINNNITPQEFNSIIPDPSRSLWNDNGVNFRLNFFHLGYIYNSPVILSEFNGSYVQTIPYTNDFFSFGNLAKNSIDKIENLNEGYAGFKFTYQLNIPNKYDEVFSLLGNRQFRALGRDNVYGAYSQPFYSIDNSDVYIKQAWIGKPGIGSNSVIFYIVADSKLCTGAFQYTIYPGETTKIDVKSTLFFREKTDKIGIAPIISSYMYGTASIKKYNNLYPAIHNSDGFTIKTSTEVWTPLSNCSIETVTPYASKELKYYGLIQRNRDYSGYLNPEIAYQQMPNVWIEPNWNGYDGVVKLVEYPYFNDNIVFNAENIITFWSPSEPFTPEKPYDFNYTINWSSKTPYDYNLAKVFSTRQEEINSGKITYAIRFSGDKINNLVAVTPLKANILLSGNLELSGTPEVIKDINNNQWITTFTIKLKNNSTKNKLCNVKLFLELNNIPQTEEWDYSWKM